MQLTLGADLGIANFHLPDSWKPEGSQNQNGGPNQEKNQKNDWHKNGAHDRKQFAVADWIRAYCNQYLPDDIAVTELTPAPERFHARLSAVKKIYTYQIETGAKCDVFSRRTCYGLGQPLDVNAMQKAAGLLCGTHDYRSFCGNKKMKKSTVRTIYRIDVKQDAGSSLVKLEFEGNGFLQNMVRILTGTLIEAGLGKRDAGSMPEILAALNRQAAGYTAPAEGLCLQKVFYE